jgi:hypothetical protein
MAVPISGTFQNRFAVAPVGAGVWGTGYNPVHAYYGSAPRPGVSIRHGEVVPPFEGVSRDLIPEEFWGYTAEDFQGAGYFVRDDRPGWDVAPEDSENRQSTGDQPSWNATGAAKTRFRATMNGAYSKFRGKLPRATYQIPTETVSEGWINKATGPRPANAVVSDPSQYEMQTSMQQRYRARNNDHAVARNTDPARSHINSRVTNPIVKVYSQGDRDYDMYPFQQTPESRRDFYYRTAGTGIQGQMLPNEMWDQEAIERTPPDDPYIGDQDTNLQYGYTPEDNFYA